MKTALNYFKETLASIQEAGTYKNERIITTPQRSRIDTTAKAGVVNFCANNYLGLSANGELIKALHAFWDDCRYVGYDISEKMIEAARENVPQADFTCCWDDLDVDPRKSLVNISSTIHEVYSYGTQADVDLFWQRIFHSGFKYVTIRDMMLSESAERFTP